MPLVTAPAGLVARRQFGNDRLPRRSIQRGSNAEHEAEPQHRPFSNTEEPSDPAPPPRPSSTPARKSRACAGESCARQARRREARGRISAGSKQSGSADHQRRLRERGHQPRCADVLHPGAQFDASAAIQSAKKPGVAVKPMPTRRGCAFLMTRSGARTAKRNEAAHVEFGLPKQAVRCGVPGNAQSRSATRIERSQSLWLPQSRTCLARPSLKILLSGLAGNVGRRRTSISCPVAGHPNRTIQSGSYKTAAKRNSPQL